MASVMTLQLVATCAADLEDFLEDELKSLGIEELRKDRGAVTFSGTWEDVWRANWRLRTANRVLVELGSFHGGDGDALRAGARNLVRRRSDWDGVAAGALFSTSHTFAVSASSRASEIRDTRWIALTVKDGIVDGQRDRYGRRASVDKADPDVHLRVYLYKNHATLLLDTSGEPLDRRGYRKTSVGAPVRENLAAACVLAAGPKGWEKPVVVDPMCGTGTLLAEAASVALGWAPNRLRDDWAFATLPGFDAERFAAIQAEPIPAPSPDVRLVGLDRNAEAVEATRENLAAAGLADRAEIQRGDAFRFEPPDGPGLVMINPPYGERIREEPAQWKRLGDLLKQRYAGYRAVVLAGGETLGKPLGLRPERRIPARAGKIEVRILTLDLYAGSR